MELGEIAKVNVGIVPGRKQAAYMDDNTVQYELFNMKIYEERIKGIQINYDNYLSNEDLSDYIVHKGELIFRLAFPMQVIIVDNELDGKLISNQYVSIKVDSDKYNPYFLKWYLESNDVGHQIEKYLLGTAIRTIPVVKVRAIRLPNIDIDRQNQFAKLIDSWDTQKKLYQFLIREKESYYNNVLEMLVKKERK